MMRVDDKIPKGEKSSVSTMTSPRNYHAARSPTIGMHSQTPVNAFQSMISKSLTADSWNPFCCWKHEDFEEPSPSRARQDQRIQLSFLNPTRKRIASNRLDVSRSRPREMTSFPRKRSPDTSISDSDITSALKNNSVYIKLQEQILTQIHQRNLHTDPELRALWKEQIEYSQTMFRKKLIERFGKRRTKSFIQNLEAIWESKMKNSTQNPDFSPEDFFTHFDAFGHREISVEEFAIIFEIIDKELSKKPHLVDKVFAFLDQSSRGTFNVHDMRCFMNHAYAGPVGEFQQSAQEYMFAPKKSAEESKELLRHRMHEGEQFVPVEADTINADTMNRLWEQEAAALVDDFDLSETIIAQFIDNVNVDDADTPKKMDELKQQDEIVRDGETELLAKIRQLRRDITSGRSSTAFEFSHLLPLRTNTPSISESSIGIDRTVVPLKYRGHSRSLSGKFGRPPHKRHHKRSTLEKSNGLQGESEDLLSHPGGRINRLFQETDSEDCMKMLESPESSLLMNSTDS